MSKHIISTTPFGKNTLYIVIEATSVDMLWFTNDARFLSFIQTWRYGFDTGEGTEQHPIIIHVDVNAFHRYLAEVVLAHRNIDMTTLRVHLPSIPVPKPKWPKTPKHIISMTPFGKTTLYIVVEATTVDFQWFTNDVGLPVFIQTWRYGFDAGEGTERRPIIIQYDVNEFQHYLSEVVSAEQNINMTAFRAHLLRAPAYVNTGAPPSNTTTKNQTSGNSATTPVTQNNDATRAEDPIVPTVQSLYCNETVKIED